MAAMARQSQTDRLTIIENSIGQSLDVSAGGHPVRRISHAPWLLYGGVGVVAVIMCLWMVLMLQVKSGQAQMQTLRNSPFPILKIAQIPVKGECRMQHLLSLSVCRSHVMGHDFKPSKPQ